MNEPLITLDDLIENFEQECKRKFGSLSLVKELRAEVARGRSLSDWGYFACLRATVLSDGTFNDAIRIFRLHRHQAAQARNRRLQHMEKLSEGLPVG